MDSKEPKARIDYWRAADATFREFDIIRDRLKKPQPELLRICCRSIATGFDTIAFAFKRMATSAVVARNTVISPRERDVLVEQVESSLPGMPPRRVSTSTRESLNIAITVYARARA